jgi:RNA polymerase sigma-70 factor (ECF subfamily)
MDDAAFGAALEAARADLRRTAIVLARFRDDDADDLVQTTMLLAWRARRTFTTGTDLGAWLGTILRNAHLNAVRRDRLRWPALGGEVAAEMPARPAEPGADEVSRRLSCALAQLSPIFREPLVLHAEGLKCREIAARCGIPTGTVLSRLSRARLKMRTLLHSPRNAGA